MPMSFPDLPSLVSYFSRRLPVNKKEQEESYRERCAQFSESEGDHIQAVEIRSGLAWDKWGPRERVQACNAVGAIQKMLDELEEEGKTNEQKSG